MNEQDNNGYVEKFIQDLRNKLIGTKLHGASKHADLSLSWYENNLGFVVRTHVPGDKNDGRIRFGSDNHTAITAMKTLLLLVNGNPIANKGGLEADVSWSFTSEVPGWDGAPAKVINRLVVGRKDGRYFIAIEEEGRPVPVFYFGPSEYHNVLINGQPASKQEISALYVTGWCEFQINNVPALLKEYYEPVGVLLDRWKEKKNKRKGGGGGNYNKPQNNNYNKPQGGGNKNWNKPKGEPVNPGEFHDGTVKSLKDFGAFVQLSGGAEGLVYKAAINGDQNAVPSQLLTVGQPVKVRVTKINEKGQISLTMKGVQQPNGGGAPSGGNAQSAPAAPQYPDNFDDDIPF